MSLSVQELQAVQERLRDHGVEVRRACPECGHRRWMVIGDLYALTRFNPDEDFRLDFAKALPLVTYVCDSCGHVRQFLASKLKVGRLRAQTPKPLPPC